MTNQPTSPPKRLIVFISGSGTNLQAIIDAIQNGELNAQVALVVSNRKEAFGLKRAEQAGVPILYFPLKKYRDAGQPRELYDRDLAQELLKYDPDLIILAGWMHIFTPAFIENCTQPVINMHPALPGQYPGTHSIQRAYAAYQRGEITHSGCMVHIVVPEVDAGALVAFEEVPFLDTDSLEVFEQRMHIAEHRLIVRAIRETIA